MRKNVVPFNINTVVIANKNDIKGLNPELNYSQKKANP